MKFLTSSLLSVIVVLSLVIFTPVSCLAQTQDVTASTAEITAIQQEVSSLREQLNASQQEVNSLREQVNASQQEASSLPEGISVSSVAFLFGSFCALWAQNTKRNPWFWFFAGLIFTVIATLVLLYKNSEDRQTMS